MIVGNAYAPFFRVNSIFWDPSIYGRYLTVGILTALAGILLGGVAGSTPRRSLRASSPRCGWDSSSPSPSRASSALAVGVIAAALVVWGRRAALAFGVLALVLALGAAGVPQVRHRIETKSRSGLDSVTSDRSALVGPGPADRASPPGGRRRRRRIQASVCRSCRAAGQAAEEGRIPHDPCHGCRGGGPARPRPASAGSSLAALFAAFRGLGRGFTSRVSFAVGLTLSAVTVHSLFYNALFEDPMTWAMLGLVGAGGQRAPQGHGGQGRRLMITGAKRALVLAPHTDDGEFGCGGTTVRLLEAGMRGAVRRILRRDAIAAARDSRRIRWPARFARRPPSLVSPSRT